MKLNSYKRRTFAINKEQSEKINKMTARFLKTTIICLIVATLICPPVLASDARLENMIISNSDKDLLVHVNAEGAFTEEITEAVMSGVSTTFSYIITLHRIRPLWINEKISSVEVDHTIKYNHLKKEFTVTRSWSDAPPVITTSFEEAQSLMTQIDKLNVAPLESLVKGESYQLKAKAMLSKFTLPLYLHYILFFMSLWDFETDWYAINFQY